MMSHIYSICIDKYCCKTVTLPHVLSQQCCCAFGGNDERYQCNISSFLTQCNTMDSWQQHSVTTQWAPVIVVWVDKMDLLFALDRKWRTASSLHQLEGCLSRTKKCWGRGLNLSVMAAWRKDTCVWHRDEGTAQQAEFHCHLASLMEVVVWKSPLEVYNTI